MVQLGEDGLDVNFQLRLAENPHEQLPASYYYSRIEWATPEFRSNFALACANCHQIGDALWRKKRSLADWEAVVARMEFRGPPLLEEPRRQLIPKMMEVFDRSYSAEDFEMPGSPDGGGDARHRVGVRGSIPKDTTAATIWSSGWTEVSTPRMASR